MSRATWILGLAAAFGLAASGYLFLENRELRAELEDRSGEEVPATAVETGSAVSGDSPTAERPRRRGLFGLGRPAAAERPELPEREKETRAERRRRRQEEIRAFLGRGESESAADYIARMRPLIEAGLERPRERLAERYREVQELAGIDEEQRASLEAAFEDTYREAIELTNQAVASGDLTPYERNWSGALQFAGGLGAVLSSAEQRIGGILTPEQRRIIADSGFEWGEYLGANAPWEDLDAPPPPPSPSGDDG